MGDEMSIKILVIYDMQNINIQLMLTNNYTL